MPAVVSAGEDDPIAEDQPLPPLEAAQTMVVPDGFEVTLFAGEPDVQQPIGFCIDDRGRLWVAEAYNYPNHTTEPGDRILILEDSDGDGSFDKRTVFHDQLNYVTGIEVGFGGVWVMSPPYFYFIPDRDGDDRPDGPPEVVLDGFGTHANAHNLANGFAWGPDGWLYGTHGRTNWSMIGKPGTPEADRVRFDGGVYRYHPVRDEWEPFTDGTTNPWGIDWDDFGEAFVCNCVNPHLFHAIQGAHFEPWRNRKSSEFAYQRIGTIADHLHFIGGNDIRDGIGSEEEDVAGGGHAHCGTMIYLGDNWPDEYRNTIFMNNIHGRRINQDILRPDGSGYRASHGADLMRSQDPWFMGVTLAYGFDGCVYVSDWSDTGECHSTRNTRRGTGRIYRISHGAAPTEAVNIAELSDRELVELQLHRNDRYVRHARRNLQERMARGDDLTEVRNMLREQFEKQSDVTRKLRALWALHVIDGIDDAFLIGLLDHSSEHIRGWSVRLLCEDGSPDTDAIQSLAQLATNDPSPRVRLQLASALQRLEPNDRWPIAEALAHHAEDRLDPNLPLMVWYGIEPLVADDLPRYIQLACSSQIPLVREHIGRRIVESERRDEGLTLLAQSLAESNESVRRELLSGMLRGLAGQRGVPLPDTWPAAFRTLTKSNDEAVLQQSIRLAMKFDDPNAAQSLTAIAMNSSNPSASRETAIESLVEARTPGFDASLLELLMDETVRQPVLKGLAAYRHPQTATRILELYTGFDEQARQQALLTLASRVDWASSLVAALELEQIKRNELTAFTARQIHSLGDEKLSAKLESLWGNVRPTDEQKRREIARLKRRLSSDELAHADLAAGRELFTKHCSNCHKFFGDGGDIGPDITGAQRTNLDYMLENLIDPNAAVSKDYQVEIIETIEGRVINGLIVNENDRTLTVQTVTEQIIIPVDDIDSRATSPKSIMPEGLLEPLSNREIRDLFGFLSNPNPIHSED